MKPLQDKAHTSSSHRRLGDQAHQTDSPFGEWGKLIALVLIATLWSNLSGCYNDNLPTTPVPKEGMTKSVSQTYYDVETGRMYLLSPNWRRVSGVDGLGESDAAETYTDWSREVEVAIWEASAGGVSVNTGVVSNVGADYVCVGGGAWADYGTGYGALLTESRPLSDYSGWAASSKDHHITNVHTLRVYAIGLKLAGVSANSLKNYLTIQTATSSQTNHPTQNVTLPSNYRVIGGGAFVNWGSGFGNLLVESYPSSSITWQTASKDHYISCAATITSYAIGITTGSITGFGQLDVAIQSLTGSTVQTGVASASMTIETGWVLACPGGRATWTDYGRMLFNIKPNGGYSMLTQSKDHYTDDDGYAVAYAIKLRKTPDQGEN